MEEEEEEEEEVEEEEEATRLAAIRTTPTVSPATWAIWESATTPGLPTTQGIFKQHLVIA